jgi:hypothetical protein
VGIFNRRNAAVGWVTWVVGKRLLKKKAKGAVPTVDPETKRPNKSAIALLLAGSVGAVTFWRRRSGGDDDTTAAE